RGVEAHVIHPSSVAVSREHRRAKTDRLDTELLKRGFLVWLRGEPGHCSMARVPTIAEEDAKRPNRERDCLVGERTRIVNRIKSTLARLGIRNFKPTLRKAAERLASVHTPEGMPLPPNTLAELQRDMARLGFVVSQIRESEEARQKRLEQLHETGPHAMVRRLARIVGVGVETADIIWARSTTLRSWRGGGLSRFWRTAPRNPGRCRCFRKTAARGCWRTPRSSASGCRNCACGGRGSGARAGWR